jgi:hypothetical protein
MKYPGNTLLDKGWQIYRDAPREQWSLAWNYQIHEPDMIDIMKKVR